MGNPSPIGQSVWDTSLSAPSTRADIVCTGETPLPGRLGRPDYAVHLNRLLGGAICVMPRIARVVVPGQVFGRRSPYLCNFYTIKVYVPRLAAD